jgi:hypothetical protein
MFLPTVLCTCVTRHQGLQILPAEPSLDSMSLYDDDNNDHVQHSELEREVQEHEVDSPVPLLNACSSKLDIVIEALGGPQQLLPALEQGDHSPGNTSTSEICIFQIVKVS